MQVVAHHAEVADEAHKATKHEQVDAKQEIAFLDASCSRRDLRHMLYINAEHADKVSS
ncbi:hypothetical protein NVIE_006190 [Nitrososphaera viennensis EN76]|uniref:Uncharacterized protein n=1 Tax=Nitrososphaera viennensis EN76 TaxID=926571 RepID=A0A060HGX8_9ARCH|nr:hypothetical protein NVIE_006190 [Nitrososphaera viennensis EN76]